VLEASALVQDLETARGALHRGRLVESRALFLGTHQRARAIGDDVVAAEAMLGYGGLWVHESRTFDARGRYLTFLAEALRSLGEEHRLLATRVAVRLNAELVYVGKGTIASVRAGVDRIREFGDAAAEAEALSLLHHLLLAPGSSADRLAVADALMDAAARSGDQYLESVALMWHTVDLFLAGSPSAERALAAFHQRADDIDNLVMKFVASSLQATLFIRSGDLAAAESTAEEALRLGLDAGDPDADAYFGALLLCTRWIRGDTADLLPVARRLDRDPLVHFMNPVFSGAIAVLASLSGEPDEAHSAIARARGILELSLVAGISSVHLTTLYAIGEAAAKLSDAETAMFVRDEATPFVHLPTLGSLGVGCFGSTWRVVAVAERTLGHRVESAAAFRQAIVANDALGHRPMSAIVRAELAELLLTGGPDVVAVEEGNRLFTDAISRAKCLGLTLRADEWAARQWSLTDALSQSRKGVSPTASGKQHGSLLRYGRVWRIDCPVGTVSIADGRGIRHLAILLQSPRREFSVRELQGLPSENRHDLVDDVARRQLVETVRKLRDGIDDANLDGDVKTADALRDELERVAEYAEQSLWRGRSRAFPDSQERGRTAVQKAVRRAIEQITLHDGALGNAFGQSVKTGAYCVFNPSAGLPDRWVVTTSA
jgi:hypothetical protein